MFKNSTLSVQLFEITLMREEILDTLSLRNIIVIIDRGLYLFCSLLSDRQTIPKQ